MSHLLQFITATALCASLCLNGCAGKDLTMQKEEVPVVPAETAVTVRTETTETVTTAELQTQSTASLQTGTSRSTMTTASQTNQTSAVTTAETAAPARTEAQNLSDHGSTGQTFIISDIYGQWETVSFSKGSGESISYDLSDPVHQSYYVGLDLRTDGQSVLMLGTEEYSAAISLAGNTLSVSAVTAAGQQTLDFTLSNDKNRMTVTIAEGRVIASLKRINGVFSIKEAAVVNFEPDIRVLAGQWYYQKVNEQDPTDYITEGFVTIDADGNYIYQPIDGSPKTDGTIQLEYEEHPNGTQSPWFAFYDIYNDFWIAAYCQTEDKDIYYIGNGAMERLLRRDTDIYSLDHYVGFWVHDRCSIQIGKEDTDYIVTITWPSSATDYDEWTYRCTPSPDNTSLECTGGGKKTNYIEDENGNTEETVIYNDGTAKFKIRGNILMWYDDKEEIAQEISFLPV